MQGRAIAETRGSGPVLTQSIEINVGQYAVVALSEAPVFLKQLGIFVNQRLSVPGQVGGGFPIAGGTVEIGRNAAPDWLAASSLR